MKIKHLAMAVALAMGASQFAIAETSSSMRGQILSPTGTAAPNTRIIIEHIPSGTRTETVTNASGNFVASGLRVGGPYRVIIDSSVHQDAEIQDIFLSLGEPYRLNTQLEASNIERIAVQGTVINPASFQAGSSSTWGEREIQTLPSFDRDLKDIVRQNPLATDLGDDNRSLSVGGNNPRFNTITVDGITQNDDFGLNSSGYPTNRSPISIDAIEQISIQSVPFNARYSGFAGARVNAVTRSGTNDLRGSVFAEYSSDSMAGNPKANKYVEGAERPPLDYTEKTYGFSLGGPIMRDRLFFFLNYEAFDKSEPVQEGPFGSSVIQAKTVGADAVQRIQQIAQQRYGVNPGDWNIAPDSDDEKLLVKIDWNINNDHRAAFTYQFAEDNAINGIRRNNLNELTLDSFWYDRNQKMNSFATQVYSNWSNSFSSEIKLSYKDVQTRQDPRQGRNFGQARIAVPAAENGRDNAAVVWLGPDRSRHANRLGTETTELQFHGEYLTGDHQIQFGTEYTKIDVFNVFIQDALGSFEFSSIENFEAGNAARVSYQNAFTNNPDDAAAEFGFSTFAAYLQDTWDISWDLTVSIGLRYERMLASDKPTLNNNFAQRYGFDNTFNLDGLDLWLPRISFNYNLTDEITIRGGMGRFSGGRPNVWISNAHTNDGVNLVTAPQLTNLEGLTSLTVPQAMRDSLQPGDGNTTPIDPNFKMPVDTRFNLAVDYDGLDLGFLGDGWFTSAEVIYTDKDREVGWVNLAKVALLDDSGNQITSKGGRPLYVSWDPLAGDRPTTIGGFNTNRHDLLLTNVSGGRSVVSTLTLGNAWDNGLSFRTSYTHQDVRDITSGGSSTASSNYNFQTAVDKQHPVVGRASYEIRHRFMATLNYRTELFEGYNSTFSLYWDRASGRPYSYALDAFNFGGFGDRQGLNSSTNYLPYIPSGPDDDAVRYVGGLTYEEFAEYVAAANLSKYAGGYAPRNEGNRGPWNTSLDFRFEQEIPGFMEGHRGAFYIDVQNVLAIFGDNQRHSVSFSDTGVRLASINIDEDGTYVYGRPFGGFTTAPPTNYNVRASTWSAKIGVRYRF
ncbi:carboxypeptidase regulatory-like domain-containing protein [Alkalimonas sp. MEB108]|uniref:Carboxypeptidase regulatory-like domain-containing protein n=1 Tax=Alkalimonas cellulosilytica TaxID=3058395 RepID=A0ABU7JA99_9GAMM|nr:TonB-dependent receptor [Alkalimonas sp. MEB108]MEE2003135.1 carboxypeptidase regulatory-like domain-containing protein [Alkalimonas sp. MEB108]